ncbi:glycine betaine ABC transporter substrate-binding protein [Geitlerinema splendidum]|nr:glycine betaine ABC transporter substrate-binding protein [Geitlerinema splendidum]
MLRLRFFFASAIAIPLGILIARFPVMRTLLLKAGSVSQTIPSLAMLALLVPILGLGFIPTILVLTFYAIYPILRNTYTGLQNIPPEYLEAAEGLGFLSFQKLIYVELPLALPMIISGLRLATATTIGIATIAAFIGAGGLGDFITQGLALNDSNLILLGAIPTAFLALAFDYGISRFENYIYHRKQKIKTASMWKYKSLLFGGMGFLFLAGYFFLTPQGNKESEVIIIGSKNFPEQNILAEIMAQLIEHKTTLKVIRKFNLGSTALVHQALLNGEIDLYPEYVGTAYLTVLKKPWDGTQKDLFTKVKENYKNQFNIRWLAPFGFSNSQSLAVRKDFAEANNLKCLSDLAPLSKNLSVAAPPEFLKRPDGLINLKKAYGFNFKNVIQVSPTLMYVTIEHQKADIIASFTTDGKLRNANLIILKDDKNIYPPYQAAPVLREVVHLKYPQIEKVLSPIFGIISEQKMINLNSKVEEQGQLPSIVAREFLNENNLISKK